MNLTTLQQLWLDTPQSHAHTHEMFVELVNKDSELDAHRTYVETKVFGMGERSFWWLWKLICEELPESSSLLEVGVFKAATMSLWKLLRPDADVYGVTPLDGRGTGWTEDDYAAHIRNIHNDFGLGQPVLYVGGSEEPEMIHKASMSAPYDVVYVDGGHSYETALSDLLNYSILVRDGGYLVIDDCNCEMKMPWGYFQGIQDVCDAKRKWLDVEGHGWEFIFSVVHISVFRRK